jgi:histidine triad (HIT) family protein
MENCVFCKIVAGEIPCNKIYEDETVLAFWDIAPQTPIHILVISKAHIGSAAEISAENSGVVAHIFEVIAEIAKTAGLENGYRVATNCGADGCQSVHHMHFHVLGGKQLSANMG